MLSSKNELRKKALALMMKESPGVDLSKKKRPMMADAGDGDAEDQSDHGADEQQEHEEEGFEQMMVSPEEKEIILKMRKHAGVGEEAGHESSHGMMPSKNSKGY
jgi:hypothetical protein